jgi:hypothetical protein
MITYEKQEGEFMFWFYPDISLSKEDNEMPRSIGNKIFEDMNTHKTTLNMLKIMNDDKIMESVTNSSITIIWFKS